MKSRKLTIALAFALATLAVLSGCAASSEPDESQTDESAVKKKVKPRAGMGAFDIVAPAWSTAGGVGQYTFAGEKIAVGGRVERAPGTYAFQSEQLRFPSGVLPAQSTTWVTLSAGNVEQRVATGLRVRFDRPVDLGGAMILLDVTANGAGRGFLWGTPNAPWLRSAQGELLLLTPGNLTVGNLPHREPLSVQLREGTLSEIVLPTSEIEVVLDAYDASYPTPARCLAPFVMAGGVNGGTSSAPVRQQNGAPLAALVVPFGENTETYVVAYGALVKPNMVQGRKATVSLNRLEVDDVEVKSPNGPTSLVPGTFTLEYQNANREFLLHDCTFDTHTGLDLPDGTYRITSVANTGRGIVTHVEEVTFP